MRQVLRETQNDYGERKRREYLELIAATLRALAEDGEKAGNACPEVFAGAYTIRIVKFARRSKAARHLFLYRVRGEVVEVGAFLYDGMEFSRHVPSEWHG
jgi:plasmid stabilization system protein ParE